MERFAGENEDPGGMEYHTAGGVGGGIGMERAGRNVGEIDQEGIAEELHSIEMDSPCANGRYEVNEQGVQVGQTPSLGQWQAGDDGPTQEAVRPAEYATEEPIYPHPGW